MLKKIIIFSIFIISIIFFQDIINANAKCSYDPNSTNVGNNLANCGLGEKLVEPGDAKIEGGFKTKILDWIKNIAGFLGLVAVGALVYAAFMMTISGGEEEKVKKAKDIVKWTILGFLGVVTAGSLIAIIVNFMYSF